MPNTGRRGEKRIALIQPSASSDGASFRNRWAAGGGAGSHDVVTLRAFAVGVLSEVNRSHTQDFKGEQAIRIDMHTYTEFANTPFLRK